MSERCETCRFWWTVNPVDGMAECRRNPPIIYGQLSDRACRVDEMDGLWPYTNQNDWCGEYQPKKAADELEG